MSDLTAVEDVMLGQKLDPGVINVLIHYVMLKTDMKLSKNYMEKSLPIGPEKNKNSQSGDGIGEKRTSPISIMGKQQKRREGSTEKTNSNGNASRLVSG